MISWLRGSIPVDLRCTSEGTLVSGRSAGSGGIHMPLGIERKNMSHGVLSSLKI